jgi:hypothetical protein
MCEQHFKIPDDLFPVYTKQLPPPVCGCHRIAAVRNQQGDSEEVPQRDFSQRGSGNTLFDYANVRQREKGRERAK